MSEIDRIEQALSFCDYDDRDIWVMTGMAIKDELGDAGRDMWEAWSQLSDKYNRKAAESVWRSFRRSGVTIGSLFAAAMEGGWTPTRSRPMSQQERAALDADRQARRNRDEWRAKQDAERAAKKAGWIMKQCKPEAHAYLHSKGFEDDPGPVWWPDNTNNLLVIPMYRLGAIAGCQLVDREGKKTFLSGQRTSHAEHVISSGGVHVWTEGYATGLSVYKSLQKMAVRSTVHITFSASNLVAMAHSGIVIADNDESMVGEKAAKKTGLPYFLPPEVGTDFNDFWRADKMGAAMKIKRFWMEARR